MGKHLKGRSGEESKALLLFTLLEATLLQPSLFRSPAWRIGNTLKAAYTASAVVPLPLAEKEGIILTSPLHGMAA